LKQVIDTTLKPGTIVEDRYTLLRQLGAGGCGAVWLASDGGPGQAGRANATDVVLKILHPHFDRYSHAVKQLAREAEILAQLAHPNIARPLEFSASGPHTYLAMEYIDGRTLDQEIGAHTRADAYFRDAEVMRLFGELSTAVSHAHSRTIIHRDLKPQNVMISRRGGSLFVKVLDFGIAKLIEGNLFDATTFGRRIGSMFYMAPEQCKGETADVRSDIFALGSLLFEVLTLRRAWAWDQSGRPLKAFDNPVPADGANALSAVLIRVATAPRPRPSDVRPDLPKQLDEVLTRAMAIEPQDRYPTVEALLTNFRRAMSERTVEFQTEIVTVKSNAPAQGVRRHSAGDDSDTRLDAVPDLETVAPPGPSPPAARTRGSWRMGKYQPVDPTAPYDEVKGDTVDPTGPRYKAKAAVLYGGTTTGGTFVAHVPPDPTGGQPKRLPADEEIDQETKDIDLLAEGIIHALPESVRGARPQDQLNTGRSARTELDDTTAPRRAVPDPDTTDGRLSVQGHNVVDSTRAGSLLANDPNATALSASVIDPNVITNPSDSGAMIVDPRAAEPGATELMFAVADPGRLAEGVVLPDENTPARRGNFRVVAAAPISVGPTSVSPTSKTTLSVYEETPVIESDPAVRISPVLGSVNPAEDTAPSLMSLVSRHRLPILGVFGMVLAFIIGVAIAQWAARRAHPTVIVEPSPVVEEPESPPSLAGRHVPYAHLELLLARLRDGPRDQGSLNALRDQIAEAADDLQSETLKMAIKREAFTSARQQDLDGLEACLKRLKKAARVR
jgi:serine/threonine protein kinase